MLYFVRHGQTDANLNGINAGGEYDIPLNATGMAQAQAFAAIHQDFLRTIDAVYVSPMIRAQQTADLILDGHKKPGDVIEDLRELKLGEWSGVSYDVTGNYFQDGREPPGGETWAGFKKRCIGALRTAAKGHSGNVLVVAHGGVWFSYASLIGHDLVHIENCGREDICRIKLSKIAI